MWQKGLVATATSTPPIATPMPRGESKVAVTRCGFGAVKKQVKTAFLPWFCDVVIGYVVFTGETKKPCFTCKN